MVKKKRLILKMASVLITFAMTVPTNGSLAVVGEPQLPRKLNK